MNIKSLIKFNDNSITHIKHDDLDTSEGFVIYNKNLESLPRREKIKYVYYGDLNQVKKIKDLKGLHFPSIQQTI